MTGDLKINGTDTYIYPNASNGASSYHIYLEEGSLEKLLSGDEQKPYVTNQSRAENGIQVLMKNPKMAEKSVTLVFCFGASTTSLQTRVEWLLTTLKAGKVVETVVYPIELTVTELSKTYRLIYEADMTLSQMNMAIGKIAIRFIEPNPTNRTIVA